MLNIMVVEDNAIVCEDLKRSINAFGYNVLGTAMNTDEAIKIANKFHIDVAILDVSLSDGYTGIDLAKKLNKKYNIEILFVTAFEKEDVLGNIQDCSNRFISKPYDQRVLRLMLHDIDYMVKD